MAAAGLLAAVLPAVPVAAAEPASPAQPAARQPLETVTVEAAYPGIAGARAEAARTPGAVTVVGADDLARVSVTSVADLLRYVPGVWADSDAGNDSVFFSSRGSNLDATDYDQNGVKLLQDGLPVSAADGSNHNRIIDPLAAQHATVARGANALAYGASTLGGAIDFVSPTARDRAGLEARLEGGSHGLGSARLTAGRVFAGGADALVTVEAKTWKGFRHHNRQDRSGLYGNAGVRLGDDVVTRFYATWLDNDQELPGALTREQIDADPDAASAGAVGGHYQLDVKTWRIANRTTWRIDSRRRLEFGVSLEEQSLFHPVVDKVLVDFDGAGPALPVEVFSLLIDTDQRDLGAMARYHHEAGAHRLTVGMNYGRNAVDGSHFRNDGGRRNGRTTGIDNRAESWELFALERWQLSPRWMLELAAQAVFAQRRARSVSVASGAVTAPSGDYSAFNPRIGLIHELAPGVSAYANVSRLYEAPTNFELEDDVRGGNQALDAMHGMVMELGLRGSREMGTGGRWFWDVAGYHAAIRNEILSMEDPAAPGTSLAGNVDDTIHSGIEALVGAVLAFGSAHTLEPRLSAALNRFRFDGDPLYGNNHLPAAPDFALRGEVLYRHAAGFYLGPTFDLVGDRYADFANRYEVGDYGLLGLRGGWEGDGWRVFATVHNLLDEHYVSTHSVRNVAAADAAILHPGAPRTAYAGVSVAL